MVANLAAKSVGTGLGAEGLNLQIDSRAICERVGLTAEGFQRVCAQTAIWLMDIKAEYGIQDR